MPCITGTYSDNSTSGECKPCAAGTYQNEMAKSSCKACPAGTYQDETGQIGCKPCGTIASTGKTYCPSATNTTDWSCNGRDCHCRRKDQAGAWSSWVFYGVIGNCSKDCGVYFCSAGISVWGDKARW
ncbi:MAG: hypothetical protein LBI17_03910 [Rickettsiales bacterium]|nr:hypothetical protein [Rickettsiales bacterium]